MTRFVEGSSLWLFVLLIAAFNGCCGFKVLVRLKLQRKIWATSKSS